MLALLGLGGIAWFAGVDALARIDAAPSDPVPRVERDAVGADLVARSNARTPVASEPGPFEPERELEPLLAAIARAEADLAAGRRVDEARAELEEAVAQLAARPRALDELLEHLSTRPLPDSNDPDWSGSDPEHVEAARRTRYGAVRGFYWVGQLDARSGRPERGRAGLSEAFVLLASLDRQTAEFLAANCAAMLSAEARLQADGHLDELLALRGRHRERADLYDRVLAAIAERLDPDVRRALARWQVTDPSDVDAVAAGLAELFALEDPWLAMEVARSAFEAADRQGRRSIALAVVRSAPVDLAVQFALERAEELANVPATWIELGLRDEADAALRLAYDDLRATEGDPRSRLLAVMGMGGADRGDLRWIATDDPDPGVRSQALLTLTARGTPDARDVGTVLDVVGRAAGDDLVVGLWAVENALGAWSDRERATTGAPLLDGLVAMVLDEGREVADRRAVLETIRGWIDPSDAAWLESTLGP